MDIENFIENSVLFSYYKNLLSDKQREYLEKYFEKDYSLSEIAEEYNITRQAVYENIRRGIGQLKSFEEKLGFYNRDMELKKRLKKIKKMDEIAKLIDEYF